MSFSGEVRSRLSFLPTFANQWLPLESNAAVLNELLRRLGVQSKWALTDIASFKFELLQELPKPTLAVIFLFPVTDSYRKYYRKSEDTVEKQIREIDSNVYFISQSIKNASGTVALIHAIANNMDKIDFEEYSVVKEFVTSVQSSSPLSRALKLEKCELIRSAHEDCAKQGQTEVPHIEEETGFHFITFVNVNSRLYELDGLKSAPVKHGTTHEKSFLKDVATVCKNYMNRDPENINFAALAFGAVG